nr:uncharacterized protein LOC113812906 [Penaeus vannamei]
MQNQTLKHTLVYESLAAENMCECRTFCWSSLRCNSATLKEGVSRVTCDLSESGPSNATAEAKTGVTSSIFWLEPLNLTYLEVLPRGIYWVPAFKTNFTAAASICSSVFGHRLMVVKKESERQLMSRAAMAIKAPILLHLTKSKAGEPVWGDGTSYTNTVMASTVQPGTMHLAMPVYKYVLSRNYPALMETDYVTEDFFMCQGDLDQ